MRIQSYITGKNHWLLEPDLPSILSQYWPEHINYQDELISFGELVGNRAYALADYIDHDAPPTLVMHDINGVRIDRARLCPAHENLLIDLAPMNCPPYRGSSWLHHFTLGFLLADPGLYCSLIVTNQTAYAIHKYAPEFKNWIDDLLAGKMWGATWMTETQGGSDLGANTTIARRENGGWKLYGEDKYFASNAGLADLAIVTARPEGAPAGPKGLALFLVPRETSEGELNFKIRRIKNKSATRAVPTGEVELFGSLAYLVGKEELGIYYTLENLTVSRLANAIGACGLARKAHLEALFRTRFRTAFGKFLHLHPLVRYDLTDLSVRTAGSLALTFHAIQAFDAVWQEHPPYNLEYHYARFLSHLVKNRTADHAAESTRLAIELFGGLGFMEECAVYRLHREALVTAIWEGTSNMQALDLLEAVQKKSAHEPFLDEFDHILSNANTLMARQAKETIQNIFSQRTKLSQDQSQWYAKDTLNRLADAAQVALLYKLSNNGEERYAKLAELYALRFLLGQPYPHWALDDQTIWYPVSE